MEDHVPLDDPELNHLDGYLAAPSSPADSSAIAGRRSSQAAVWHAARHIFRREVPAAQDWDIAAWMQELHDTVIAGDRPRPALRRSMRVQERRRSWLGMSLSMCAGLVAVAVIGWQMVAPTASPTHHIVRYTTRAAEIGTVRLADGSQVILGPASKLTANRSSSGNRYIELSGEAQFTVAHDAAAAFHVRTGDVITRVLGTVFAVRAYPRDPAVQVAVESGRVMVARHQRETVVTPGVSIIFGDSVVTADPRGAAAATAWVNGKLVFSRTPVAEVLRVMGRWSGYEIVAGDSAMLAGRVSTVLSVDDPKETMHLLAELLNATAAFDGTTVTLRRGPSGRVSAPKRYEPPPSQVTSTQVGK